MKCGEEVEDGFDACWSCGTSRDGVEDRKFKPEIDEPEQETPARHIRCLRASLVGAGIAGLLAILHPFVMLHFFLDTQIEPEDWPSIFVTGAYWAIFAAPAGAMAGAAGALNASRAHAAAIGATACVALHILFFLLMTANLLAKLPLYALLLTMALAATTGAASALVGAVVAGKHGAKSARGNT